MKNILVISSFAFILIIGCKTNSVKTEKEINIVVNENGYTPNKIKVPKHLNFITLNFKRTTDKTCAREVISKDLGINKKLPLNKVVQIKFDVRHRDSIIFGCHMNMMYKGVLIKEQP